MLSENLISLDQKTSYGQKNTFKCLNIRFLMATMLSYCKSRNLLWDPRKDILYLCKNEHAEVQRIRTHLNVKEVQELFLGTSFFYRLHVDDQRLCYRLLLNTDPPPTMAITPPAPQISSFNQSGPLPLEQNTDRGSSRPEYRKISGQRSSSSGTSDHRTPKKERPQSMDYLQNPRLPSHIIDISSVKTAKPQPVSAAIATKRARRSMPNLTIVNNAILTLDASVQEAKQTATHPQSYAAPRISHSSGQPRSASPSQGDTISQLEYGGSFQPAYIRATAGSENISQDLSPDQKTIANPSDFARPNSTRTIVSGIQSQKGSLHTVSPEGEEILRQQDLQDEGMSLHRELRLVSPEGIYSSPEGPQRVQHHRNRSAPPLQRDSIPTFELDGMSPPKHEFIAELPANPIILPAKDRATTENQSSLQIQNTSKPLHPHTSIAPLETESLPASLIAGGSALHTHRRSLSHLETSIDTIPDFPTAQTNASRYLTYVFPQSTAPEVVHSLPEQSSTSAYRAYRPSVISSCEVQQASGEDSVIESLHPANGTGHKRNVSNDSIASYDSSKLAKEYQELINIEDGYSSH